MSEELDQDTEMDEQEQQDNLVTLPRSNIRQLEKSAKRAKTAEAEAIAAKRELAFLKAGIDTESKLGKLFFKSYDSDDLTVEAIQAEARELGLIEAPTEGAPANSESTPLNEGEDRMTAERQALATGANPDTHDQAPDPNVAAINAATDVLANQGSSEEAFATAFQSIVGAAQDGDERVLFRP